MNTHFDNKVLSFGRAIGSCNSPWWFGISDWIINNKLYRRNQNNMAATGCQHRPAQNGKPLFELGCIIVGLLEAGRTYRWIAAHVGHNVLVCVAAYSSGLWNIPTGSGCSGGRPTSIQGRNPGIFCTCCVTKDYWEPSVCNRTQITCAFGQITTYTMTLPSTATLVSWKSLLDSGMVFCCLHWWDSFCLYASDGRTGVWRRPGEHLLPECVCSWHKGPTSAFMMWWVISYNSGHICCFCRVK